VSLHPILAVNQVIDEYRDYLLTEFRAKDSGLRQSLEQALDQPLFLAQEPFFQAHRPFKNGKPWRDLSIDAKLARVMEERSRSEFAYLHQSLAINELLAEAPRPVVVTTGTGSGKTEAFLLPVIQNAIEDATRFNKIGLTSILVYPMNALANDQELRIKDYLESSGFAGAVMVARYDRSTPERERQWLREHPPHILLTNYMMLEYLLVRPKDRDGIFANHRCRYLVLDEVHTYRGTLGSNIALLARRARTHLARARQDWHPDAEGPDRKRRYPSLVPVGTSATIKSVSDSAANAEEALRQRDAAVQEFFGKLVGVDSASIRVIGEELEDVHAPSGAGYTATPAAVADFNIRDAEQVRSALSTLGGQPTDTPAANAVQRCRLLWDLNRWLIRSPMSVSQIVERVQSEVPERKNSATGLVRAEVEAALVAGAALPEGTPGALRLRAHRFLRGGWHFHRCISPTCGRLYPMGEERCECGYVTAPLFLCRACGADFLRFVGNPEQGPLKPSGDLSAPSEWMLYQPNKFEASVAEDEEEEEGEEGAPRRRSPASQRPTQIKKRPVLEGTFDPRSLSFSVNKADYPMAVLLAPARTQCLCCGGTAGSRAVLTSVALGTSAAVKVIAEGLVESLAEANRDKRGHDGKERLLVFSDSRQDAAHQARFVIFASRYDRMRRRLTQVLKDNASLPIQRAVELLGEAGVRERDNPFAPSDEDTWLTDEARDRLRAWEEAPLLDDLSVTAGYRATVINLGLVGVRYHRLDEYVNARGEALAGELGISREQLEYLCRSVLDDMRARSCLSRELLRYHPLSPSCPEYVRKAEWERRIKQPQGHPASPAGRPVAYGEATDVPYGIRMYNAWRKPGAGGRGPRLERLLKQLLDRFGGKPASAEVMTDLLEYLEKGGFITAVQLYGAQKSARLFQVNAETVRLELLDGSNRFRCKVCIKPAALARAGLPCVRCHGVLELWTDADVARNRYVRRIRAASVVPLVAHEHTAQVPTHDRIRIEDLFKAPLDRSKVNILACSPTLEMGIDVGGLDAIVLRNVPPRPDNYAQRGGRAGRRSRIGLVLGYARATPHDQYFYDRPTEMIAGEVPAPILSLGNRDVTLRHLNAIVFGAAEPGLSGRMFEYVSPQGEVKQDAVDSLIGGLKGQFGHALELAKEAWGADVLGAGTMNEADLHAALAEIPARVQDVMNRTARQVRELRQALDVYAAELKGKYAGTHAAELIAGLLGIPNEKAKGRAEADDRSAGYPMRRLAEFGILPGYEFPTEPAALRLLGDEHEEDPVTVGRRFGIGQFQPEAQVYARAKRWKVVGLDSSSPWNPAIEAPSWTYRVCAECDLRFRADHPRCPRCGTDTPGKAHAAYEFGGFLGRRDESPVLDEEERYATKNRVEVQPQWDGDVVGRWTAGPGWGLQLRRGEEVQWLNEGPPPSENDLENAISVLHKNARGYFLCPACGRALRPPERPASEKKGKLKPNTTGKGDDPYGHSEACSQKGSAPKGIAIGTSNKSEVLRLLLPLPSGMEEDEARPWALSLGSALRIGMRHLYMLDGSEIDFEFEGPWKVTDPNGQLGRVALSFVDPSLGGTGYLGRIADELHLVARRALEHLDHAGCETACYRCLKSYQNQRFHDLLRWPLAVPYLEALAAEAPVRRRLETGDIDDPKPWLESYAAGVGSPLELKFLKLFEQHGFRPEKQFPVAPDGASGPISIADFAVPERRLAIYIDGAAFHTGANLRRDRYIRERLRKGNPPWRVEELRAADLAQGAALVKRLQVG
jgi:Lhr-like helicase